MAKAAPAIERLLRFAGISALVLALHACAAAPDRARSGATTEAAVASSGHDSSDDEICASAADCLTRARSHAGQAQRSRRALEVAWHWQRCAESATRSLQHDGDATVRDAAARWASHCSGQLLSMAPRRQGLRVQDGRARIAGLDLVVERRVVSAHLAREFRLIRSADIPGHDAIAQADNGFGVPVALMSARCEDSPVCRLLPLEGVFRSATAWIEPGDGNVPARLVLVEPEDRPRIRLGSNDLALASDRGAFYDWGVRASSLRRLGILALFGDPQVGERAGVYLLDDYDPDKRPLVMIHGLGSNPLIWARLSQAVWSDPQLDARFQVWHVVYPTNAPTLVLRRRLHEHLDAAWRLLDPEGDDPARRDLVLVGHSLGGVLARLLAADSGEALWSAAFAVSPAQLQGDATDVDAITATFRFQPYPGVRRVVMLAAPHRGSPKAESGLARVVRALVGRRTPELDVLRQVARLQPTAIHASVRDAFLRARINSVVTLQPSQPVRRAGEALLPAPGIAWHTIAGSRGGEDPPGDGVVPLDSALLPGAASTLVVDAGHRLTDDPRVITEVLRILREHVAH